jgi:hypothetical protein
MPQNQVANIAVFDFGAPAATATVLKFRAKPNVGGKLDLKFENSDGANQITVSVEVSADNVTYAATTAGNNLAAVTNLAVPRKVSKEATILLRRGVDLYLRVTASGSARGQLQMRGDPILEPMTI